MAQVVLHHARTGKANIIQVAGYDKGNFGKGSKALYSGARAVLNIAPGDPEDHAKIVVVCAKANDANPFEPIGAILNEETMLYEVDPGFDPRAWADDVEGKRAGATEKVHLAQLIEICRTSPEGGEGAKEIHAAIGGEEFCTLRTVERKLAAGVAGGYLRRRGSHYVATGKYAGGK
jgi:hypothetical protein